MGRSRSSRATLERGNARIVPAAGLRLRWRDGGFVNSLAALAGWARAHQHGSIPGVCHCTKISASAKTSQLARKENCCQETYDCETKRIEAEFTKKMATCHFPGNAGCF